MSKMEFKITITGAAHADLREDLGRFMAYVRESFGDRGIDVKVTGRHGFRDLVVPKAEPAPVVEPPPLPATLASAAPPVESPVESVESKVVTADGSSAGTSE